VEDERSLAGPLTRGLEEEGYVVEVAADGRTGLMKALAENYDVLIVDWRLPGIDGRTLVERLRAGRSMVPVLMLTALRDLDHRVSGLDAGADDYLTKPFSFEELLARLRALRRRKIEGDDARESNGASIQAGPLRLDVPRRKAWLGGREVELRSKEYRLLELLARRAGEVVSRTVIAERVWGSPFEVTDNAIDVTVSNLRNRLGATADGTLTVSIETIRGVGYRFIAKAIEE
jgi:two-component system OmpR family response regulator